MVSNPLISICKEVRGKALSKRLLAGVFDYAAQMSTELGEHFWITLGGFTPKGERSILPAMRELSVDYSHRGVTFDPPERYRP